MVATIGASNCIKPKCVIKKYNTHNFFLDKFDPPEKTANPCKHARSVPGTTHLVPGGLQKTFTVWL